MNDIINLSSVDARREELEAAFLQIFQGRSDFQIEKFVVNSHVTSERQYAQCVLELQVKYYSVKKAEITRKRLLRSLETPDLDDLDREDILLDLQQHELGMLNALREFDCLYRLFQSFPKFTRQELEEAEAHYWYKRLMIQAQQDVEEHGTISTGNAEALRQIDVIRDFESRFIEKTKDHSAFNLRIQHAD